MMGTLVSMVAIVALVSAVSPASADVYTEQSFSEVDRIELDGVSGDVTIREWDGKNIRVEVTYKVRPSDAFHPEMKQRDGTVYLAEKWGRGKSSGDVMWVIEIPESATPMIEIGSSSGDLYATGVAAWFDFHTSSGDVRLDGMSVASQSSFSTSSGDFRLTSSVFGKDVVLKTSSGDIFIERVVAGTGFEISTSSGDVRIQKSRGVLEGSSSSGDVEVRDTDLSGPSRFSSSSGEVSIRLAEPPEFELEASSSSGNVRLETDFGNNFTLIMSRREDRGRIDSPFKPTSQSTYEHHGQRYIRQVVERGSGGPEIRLHTASGKITVSN